MDLSTLVEEAADDRAALAQMENVVALRRARLLLSAAKMDRSMMFSVDGPGALLRILKLEERVDFWSKLVEAGRVARHVV